jgi:hypothetical protein
LKTGAPAEKIAEQLFVRGYLQEDASLKIQNCLRSDSKPYLAMAPERCTSSGCSQGKTVRCRGQNTRCFPLFTQVFHDPCRATPKS